MRIGALRHWVVIQQLARTLDGSGNTVEAWSDFASVYAEVAPLSAREFVAGQAVQSGVDTRITIRYLAGVRPTMRILHDGRLFNIQGVLSDTASGREYLTLPCSEGVNDG